MSPDHPMPKIPEEEEEEEEDDATGLPVSPPTLPRAQHWALSQPNSMLPLCVRVHGGLTQ